MKAYRVTGFDRDEYNTCWVVAETPARAKVIALDRSPKIRDSYDYVDLRVQRAPEFEDGEDLSHAHYIADIDTGTEPCYYEPISWLP